MICAIYPCMASSVQTIVHGMRRATVEDDAKRMQDANVTTTPSGCSVRSVLTVNLLRTAPANAHGSTPVVGMAVANGMVHAAAMTAGLDLLAIRALLAYLERSVEKHVPMRLTAVDMAIAHKMVNAYVRPHLVVLRATHALRHTDSQGATTNVLPRRRARARDDASRMAPVSVSPTLIAVECEILWRHRCPS